MRIEQIEPITLRVPWGPADWGEFRDWTIVRVYADDGRVGIGRGGDPRLIRSEFEDLLVGQDSARIAFHWQAMFDKAWRFKGPGAAAMGSICGVDIALWTCWDRLQAFPYGGSWEGITMRFLSMPTVLAMKTRI